MIESEQAVESLKKRGIPVEYVLFPDEGHGFLKIPNRVRSTVAVVEWFDKYESRGRSRFEVIAAPQGPGALQVLSGAHQLGDLPDVAQVVKRPIRGASGST